MHQEVRELVDLVGIERRAEGERLQDDPSDRSHVIH
jgi:hypothetical protein